MPDDFEALYYFETDSDPHHVFEKIALEQTNAGYNTLKRKKDSDLQSYQGKISHIEIVSAEGKAKNGRARISYPAINLDAGGNRLESLLRFCAGESSSIRGFKKLKLMDIQMTDSILSQCAGPRFGVPGIRKKLGIDRRPLLIGPLRPETGMSAQDYAHLTYQALKGGADIIKDDELVVDPAYAPLAQRAPLCAQAARKAEDETGQKKMFILNIGCDLSRIAEYIETGNRAGVDGFMVHPRLTPSLITLARQKTEAVIVSHHDTLTLAIHGSGNITHALMAKLFRLSGSDLIVVPRPCAHFDIDGSDYQNTLKICLQPMLNIPASMPMPARGNTIQTVHECREITGSLDYALVAGTVIFEHPDSVEAGARALSQALANCSLTS